MSPTTKPPRPPAHLSRARKAWWSRMVAEFDLAGSAHTLDLLTIAAEALDRRQQARETIAEAGPYFINSRGEPRPHPALAIERDSAVTFARSLRELALP